MLKRLIILLVLSFILFGNLTLLKADALVDYSFDKKTIIIIVNYGINEQDKPKILEVYINGTLFRTYYFNENETFPKFIYINMTIKGFTSISVRTYNAITGWSKGNEIYVNSVTMTTPNLNIGREIALIVGVIILLSAIFLILRRKG